MTPSRIQDPKGAKTLVVSYKATTGAAEVIYIQQFKIVCFADSKTCKLIVNKDATLGEKQYPNAEMKAQDDPRLQDLYAPRVTT